MKGYWHEIRQENCTEMYFRESKICYIAINSYSSQNISTGPSSCKNHCTSLLATVCKWNSDTQQIGDVKKIQKELFQFDDKDDNILATAASEAESNLFSVK